MLEKCIVFPYHQRKTHRYQENFEVLMSCIMKYISKSMYIRSLSKTNKIPPSKHLFFQSSSGFCSFPLQWWTMFFHLHLHDSKVSFCGAGMSKKEWVMKMVALILNFCPLMVYWDIGTKWWQLLVPGTVSPNSYQGFKFSLTATISSLLIVRKVIPYMDDLQYSLTAECQDLIINRSLQTGKKFFTFDSTANSIAGRFPMACCNKYPCCINAKIWLVVAKVQKGLVVLVLPSTAVNKIVSPFDLGEILLDVKHDYSLQLSSWTKQESCSRS